MNFTWQFVFGSGSFFFGKKFLIGSISNFLSPKGAFNILIFMTSISESSFHNDFHPNSHSKLLIYTLNSIMNHSDSIFCIKKRCKLKSRKIFTLAENRKILSPKWKVGSTNTYNRSQIQSQDKNVNSFPGNSL